MKPPDIGCSRYETMSIDDLIADVGSRWDATPDLLLPLAMAAKLVRDTDEDRKWQICAVEIRIGQLEFAIRQLIDGEPLDLDSNKETK